MIAEANRGIVISITLSALACIGYGISQLPQALQAPPPTQTTDMDLIGPPGPTESLQDYKRDWADDRNIGAPGADGIPGPSYTPNPYPKPRLGGTR